MKEFWIDILGRALTGSLQLLSLTICGLLFMLARAILGWVAVFKFTQGGLKIRAKTAIRDKIIADLNNLFLAVIIVCPLYFYVVAATVYSDASYVRGTAETYRDRYLREHKEFEKFKAKDNQLETDSLGERRLTPREMLLLVNAFRNQPCNMTIYRSGDVKSPGVNSTEHGRI